VSLNQIGRGPVLRVAELLERSLYRTASAVTAVTRPFCDHIDRIRARHPSAIFLPNGTLEQFLEDVAPVPRDRLGVPADAFLVTFAGTHGIAQALPKVIEAAMQANHSRIHFALIGEGPIKDALVAQAQNERITNITFVPPFNPSEVARALAASDALLVPLSKEEIFKHFIPSKLFDYLAAGKPVILSARGESEKIVQDAQAGVVVEPEDAHALASAVSWLAQHPAEAREMGEHGRTYARRHLRSAQAERLEATLRSVAR
jgi:glycosyltransferase involved in cell wall biosynthesis